MLPSLGFQEILLLGVLALLVVGPKDLPLLLRKLGRFTAKLRGMAQEFRSGFDELARQAELDELKKEVDALRRSSALNELEKEFSRPLGTLESYAGISPPPAPLPAPVDTTAAPEETPAPDAAVANGSVTDTPAPTPAAPTVTESVTADEEREPLVRSAP